MHFSSEEEIHKLVKRFEDRTLPKSEWTHAAHLTVGLHYCVHHAFGVAKNLMSDGIYWLNDSHGTANTENSGYHETLTVFWLRQVADFIKANDTETDIAAVANKLVTELSDRNLPLKIYSRELLFSPAARARLVDPDLVVVRGGGLRLAAEPV
jgi:hypothetical protein